ncbi:hypothetical protein GUITHDRAFT_146771 [Guillardia theta CCMP2712]|uniref:Uncharacterized protein n=1 Tax=Guillardia theta (strain CCMP2712) TaxID=905079 RepID=L1IFR3_GUITC|nr:hypothetical protein GUITHDRAFT_146771 [Guillardia theta CCMP2712]EKX35101.1 hypothetical protein GUITHDRAFT_146771 [Guillardia theta CCMP2712]|eukprot:XP_005822081.1 hypothetical protein GUITHDRAFT_146771 [Guillardia theta CCMP2712]
MDELNRAIRTPGLRSARDGPAARPVENPAKTGYRRYGNFVDMDVTNAKYALGLVQAEANSNDNAQSIYLAGINNILKKKRAGINGKDDSDEDSDNQWSDDEDIDYETVRHMLGKMMLRDMFALYAHVVEKELVTTLTGLEEMESKSDYNMVGNALFTLYSEAEWVKECVQLVKVADSVIPDFIKAHGLQRLIDLFSAGSKASSVSKTIGGVKGYTLQKIRTLAVLDCFDETLGDIYDCCVYSVEVLKCIMLASRLVCARKYEGMLMDYWQKNKKYDKLCLNSYKHAVGQTLLGPVFDKAFEDMQGSDGPFFVRKVGVDAKFKLSPHLAGFSPISQFGSYGLVSTDLYACYGEEMKTFNGLQDLYLQYMTSPPESAVVRCVQDRVRQRVNDLARVSGMTKLADFVEGLEAKLGSDRLMEQKLYLEWILTNKAVLNKLYPLHSFDDDGCYYKEALRDTAAEREGTDALGGKRYEIFSFMNTMSFKKLHVLVKYIADEKVDEMFIQDPSIAELALKVACMYIVDSNLAEFARVEQLDREAVASHSLGAHDAELYDKLVSNLLESSKELEAIKRNTSPAVGAALGATIGVSIRLPPSGPPPASALQEGDSLRLAPLSVTDLLTADSVEVIENLSAVDPSLANVVNEQVKDSLQAGKQIEVPSMTPLEAQAMTLTYIEKDIEHVKQMMSSGISDADKESIVKGIEVKLEDCGKNLGSIQGMYTQSEQLFDRIKALYDAEKTKDPSSATTTTLHNLTVQASAKLSDIKDFVDGAKHQVASVEKLKSDVMSSLSFSFCTSEQLRADTFVVSVQNLLKEADATLRLLKDDDAEAVKIEALAHHTPPASPRPTPPASPRPTPPASPRPTPPASPRPASPLHPTPPASPRPTPPAPLHPTPPAPHPPTGSSSTYTPPFTLPPAPAPVAPAAMGPLPGAPLDPLQVQLVLHRMVADISAIMQYQVTNVQRLVEKEVVVEKDLADLKSGKYQGKPLYGAAVSSKLEGRAAAHKPRNTAITWMVKMERRNSARKRVVDGVIRACVTKHGGALAWCPLFMIVGGDADGDVGVGPADEAVGVDGLAPHERDAGVDVDEQGRNLVLWSWMVFWIHGMIASPTKALIAVETKVNTAMQLHLYHVSSSTPITLECFPGPNFMKCESITPSSEKMASTIVIHVISTTDVSRLSSKKRLISSIAVRSSPLPPCPAAR